MIKTIYKTPFQNALNIWAAVLFFAGMLLLVSLGGWQWLRGLEKSAVERARADPQHITLARAPSDWRGLEYRRVQLRGDWLAPVFLLNNRVHNGKPGYEALSPFQLSGDNAILLVNRGWIARATSAAALRGAPKQTVRGELRVPQKGFTLGPAYREQTGWPKVIEYFDAAALSEIFANETGALQPAMLTLAPDHPAAFVSLRPAYAGRFGAMRHFGYAVQWWGLAATLLVFGFIWRRARRA